MGFAEKGWKLGAKANAFPPPLHFSSPSPLHLLGEVSMMPGKSRVLILDVSLFHKNERISSSPTLGKAVCSSGDLDCP